MSEVLIAKLVYLLFFACGATLIFLFVVMILANPRLTILLLLVTRPMLSVFARKSLGIPGASSVYLNPAGVLNILLIGGGIVYIFKKKVNILQFPVSRPYLAFLYIVAATILISRNRSRAIFEWAKLISPFVFYVLLVDSTRDRKDIQRLVLAILLSWIIPNFVSFYQIFTGTGVWDRSAEVYRIGSTFGRANEYADFLMVYLILVMVLFIYSRSLFKEAGLAVIGLMMLVSLYYTYTRAPVLGLFVATTLIAILRQKKWLILLALAVIVYFLRPGVTGRFGQITEGGGSISVIGRFEMWASTIGSFVSSPLIGHGFASYQMIAKARYYAGIPVAAHNDYLRMLIETGILGLTAFLFTLGFLLRDGIRTLRRASDPYYQYLALGSIATIVGAMVTAVFANVFVGPALQWYIWGIAGIAYKALYIDEPDDVEDSERSVSRSAETLQPLRHPWQG